MKNYREQLARYFARMAELGFTYNEADAIRLDAERIDTWNTKECNGHIEWAEAGQTDHRGRALKEGRPYSRWGFDSPHSPPSGYYAILADRYTPAVARIDVTVAAYGLTARHQSDPRGLPVYIVVNDRDEVAVPIRPNKRIG